MILTRRHLLLQTAAGALLGSMPLSSACARREPAPPSWPRTTTYEGIEMIELFPNGADETSPLVVAIHGMGDRPDRWVEEWRTFPARVQIALPRALSPHGTGFSWFRFEDGMTDEQFGAEVGDAEARLWKGIAKLAGKRRVIVTGFSQGGILSFAIASRRPAEVLASFPVAGSCPGPLLPVEGVPSAPIVAFHGTADRVLDVKWAREAVAAFKKRGSSAELHEYEGVGHSISPQMHRDHWEAIGRAVTQR